MMSLGAASKPFEFRISAAVRKYQYCHHRTAGCRSVSVGPFRVIVFVHLHDYPPRPRPRRRVSAVGGRVDCCLIGWLHSNVNSNYKGKLINGLASHTDD